MSQVPADYIAQQANKIESFRRALTKESDRGCGLFATAYIDKALSDLLFVSLVSAKEIERDLFEGTAPLGSFSARIKMGYYLGLISSSCRRDLDILRKIRNDFAHDPDIMSFEEPAVAQRCRSLRFSYHAEDKSPRLHFTAATFGVLSLIHVATLKAKPHTEKADDTPSEGFKAKHRKMFEELGSDDRQKKPEA
jgi:DNA-binding MltR family transcriptional regulator